MAHVAWGLVAAGWLGTALPALGAPRDVSAANRPSQTTALHWPLRAQPEASGEFATLLQRGHDLSEQVLMLDQQGVGRRNNLRLIATKAALAYKQALTLVPDNADAWYYMGRVLYVAFAACDTCSRTHIDASVAATILGAWRTLEQVAPNDPRLPEVWFDSALIHTRLASDTDFQAALDCYHKLLSVEGPVGIRQASAVWYGNAAETHMMLGHLTRAIQHYETAMLLSPSISASYGLAVALDRDGQTDRAKQIVLAYGQAGLQQFNDDIQSGATFFVPEGEAFYYLGVAYDALGMSRMARHAFQEFITSGVHPRFHARARQHLQALDHVQQKPGR